jgi:hypothetical protein
MVCLRNICGDTVHKGDSNDDDDDNNNADSDETVEHIITACPILAREQYVKRHDSVCSTTIRHMQGKRGKIREQTLVCPCTRIS